VDLDLLRRAAELRFLPGSWRRDCLKRLERIA
jgi:hypothetical protein